MRTQYTPQPCRTTALTLTLSLTLILTLTVIRQVPAGIFQLFKLNQREIAEVMLQYNEVCMGAGCVHGCTSVCVYGRVSVWVHGCRMGVWVYGCMSVWVYGRVSVWVSWVQDVCMGV